MKWYEILAAIVLGAFVVVVVFTGLQQRGARMRTDRNRPVAAAPDDQQVDADLTPNVTLVGPPTIHDAAPRR